MYQCRECGYLFEIPSTYIERHGLDSPPYETTEGCPICGGAYHEAKICDICGQYIEGDYVKINSTGQYICSDCYEIGEM